MSFPVNRSYTEILSSGGSNGSYSGLLSDPMTNSTGGATANYESIGGPAMRGGGSYLSAQSNGYGFSNNQNDGDMNMRGIASYGPALSGGKRRRRRRTRKSSCGCSRGGGRRRRRSHRKRRSSKK